MPRMLGRSSKAGVSTGDVRHPLPPFTIALPVLAQVGFRCSSGPLRGVPTGDGRHLQPSLHWRRAAQAAAPGQVILHIWKICLSLPYRRCWQNRLNSVGQFCTSPKLTLHSSSLLRPGIPRDPSETPDKVRVPWLRRPNFFLLLRPKDQPFGNPPASAEKSRGPTLNLFFGSRNETTNGQT